MTGFWHTYGALITVVLVVLNLVMILVVCRTFLSDGSDADHQVTGEEGNRLRHEGRTHE